MLCVILFIYTVLEVVRVEKKRWNLEINILENLPHSAICVDKQLNIVSLNKLARENLKLFQDDDEIRNFLFYYEKLKTAIEPVENSTSKNFEMIRNIRQCENFDEYIIKINSTVWGEIKYYKVAGYSVNNINEKADFVMVFQDITSKYGNKLEIDKEKEKLLSLSSELKTKCEIIELLRNKEKEYLLYLKNIVTNLSEGIIVLDKFGEFSLSNKAVYEITNLKPKEIIKFFELDNKFEIFNEPYNNYSLTEVYKKYIRQHRTLRNIIVKFGKSSDKTERFFELNTTPVAEGGQFINTIITIRDVTEEINHNLRLQEINRIKDEFFTVSSHELRTPLTIIKSSIQLAYDVYGSEISGNIDKTLKRVNQNCSRLLKLVNNILDLSKAEAGFLALNSSNFDIVNETEAIVESANVYAASKGINLIFDTNEEEARVLMDKDKYGKIVLNLLSNAIKFTSEGKKIMVCIQIKKEHISLVVEDEGIGIPKDKIEYIFERFAQVSSTLSRDAEGTGIGLSIVKKFVELMKGKITVISEIGRGSTFMVKFKRFVGEDNSTDINEHTVSSINEKINIEFSDIS